MSVGTLLLTLQELDLALARDRAALNAMPEIAELAKKRRAYQKLKAEATKLFARRKDIETYLEELDGQEMDANDDVRIAQRNTDSSDYRAVQQLELELSNLAKQLDKIAFDRRDYERQLADITAKQNQLAEYTAKFEAAFVADTKAAREKAASLTGGIERAEGERARVLDQIPAELRGRYESAAAAHGGLAVERLEGNVPSVCRMALQASSMSDLSRVSGDITECPYCHRILIMDEGGER